MIENEITIKRGDTPVIRLTVKRYDGSVFNLTGYTPELTVKTNESDPDSAAVIIVVGIVTDVASGECQFDLSEANTDLVASVYYYDTQLKNGTKVYTPVKSTFTVEQDIRRAGN